MRILWRSTFKVYKYFTPYQIQYICLSISVKTHGFLCYSMSYNLLLSLVANGNPFQLAHGLLDVSPAFFEHFLAFWHSKMFQAHIVLSLAWLWNQPFLQRGFFLLENGIYKWKTEGQTCSMLLTCHWLQAILVGRSKEHTHTHTQIHRHIHTL